MGWGWAFGVDELMVEYCSCLPVAWFEDGSKAHVALPFKFSNLWEQSHILQLLTLVPYHSFFIFVLLWGNPSSPIWVSFRGGKQLSL